MKYLILFISFFFLCIPLTDIQAKRLMPEDFIYKGAFRLPEVDQAYEYSWHWGGDAMTYCPDDGGSLYATGHDHNQWVSEINIPQPRISNNINDLNTARTLQPFTNIRRGLGIGDREVPRMGLEYLGPRGNQKKGRIHFSWGQHFFEDLQESHAMSLLVLDKKKSKGPWYLGKRTNYTSGDYLFKIPKNWVKNNVKGKLLATGRFRDGGWSGMGPSLIAYGPWGKGQVPSPQATLKSKALIKYTSSDNWDSETQHSMNNYHQSDEWVGGAWIKAGNKRGIIFAGTKGTGECWYGFANGVVWPDEPPYPPIPDPPNDDRGWWSTGFKGELLFYNPKRLKKVAAGSIKAWEPQPYATMDIDEFMYNVSSTQQKRHISSVAFNQKHDKLYIMEYLADDDKPIVHVWKIKK